MKNTRCKKTLNLFTKTNAQRQQDYRQRQKEKQGVRFDTYLDKDVHAMLESIAASQGETMKVTLSNIIKKEYAEMLLD